MKFPMQIRRSMSALILSTLTMNIPAYSRVFSSLETSNYQDIAAAERELEHEMDPHRILIVLDIDNTTLANTGDLGSEHWALWQHKLLSEGVRGLPAVAGPMDDVIHLQELMYQVGHMMIVSS